MIKETRTIKKSGLHGLDFNRLELDHSKLNNANLNNTKINGIESIDYFSAQAQLAKTMRRVCENNSPIAIDGIGKDRVVLMPLEHFQKLTNKK